MRNKNRSLTFRYNADATFDAKLDGERLSSQAGNVAFAMRSGHWRTLREISKESGAPEASATLPVREEDTSTVKQPAVIIAKLGGDHTGQTKIDGVGDE